MTHSCLADRTVHPQFEDTDSSRKIIVKTLTSGLIWTLCILLSACQMAEKVPVLNDSISKQVPIDTTDNTSQKNNSISKREWIAALSIVNTTDNTFLKDGTWQSSMGALSTVKGGLACDNVAPDMKFHKGDYRLWYLAPSDAKNFLSMKKCSHNIQGKDSEPSCFENWDLCGRKVRVKCLDPEFCGKSGEPSLVSQINTHAPPVNNYLPNIIVNELSQALGKNPKTAGSVVLYITDFCPAVHSNNIKSQQCQRQQVDISTSAFLMLGKTNAQGYINTNLDVSVELLDPNDATPVGPES